MRALRALADNVCPASPEILSRDRVTGHILMANGHGNVGHLKPQIKYVSNIRHMESLR